MERRATTAETIAVELQRRIRDTSWPPHGLMPPLRLLSRELGCSVPTLLKAVQALKTRGLLSGGKTRGGRIWVAGSSEATADLQGGHTSCERIFTSIRAQILKGHLTSGARLPSLKELTERLGGSHPTLQRALRRLVSEGYIEAAGRGYRVRGASTSPPRRAQIVVVTGSRSLFAQAGFALSFCRSLEMAAKQRGWPTPRIVQDFHPDVSPVPDQSTIAGYVSLPTGNTRGWSRFFKEQPDIPFIAANLMEEVRSRFVSHALFFRFMPDNKSAGREVALHLLSKGHRRCAFFSAFPLTQPWSSRRYEGAREVFESTPDGFMDLCIGGPPDQSPRADGDSARFRGWIGALGNSRSAPAGLAESIRSAGMANVRETCRILWPRIERVAADTTITAWVGVNDQIAALLMSYLEWRGIALARQVAVAGFDNSPLAIAAGLTSFDMGAADFASLAVLAFSDPASMRTFSRDHTVRIRGALFERSST